MGKDFSSWAPSGLGGGEGVVSSENITGIKSDVHLSGVGLAVRYQ